MFAWQDEDLEPSPQKVASTKRDGSTSISVDPASLEHGTGCRQPLHGLPFIFNPDACSEDGNLDLQTWPTMPRLRKARFLVDFFCRAFCQRRHVRHVTQGGSATTKPTTSWSWSLQAESSVLLTLLQIYQEASMTQITWRMF